MANDLGCTATTQLGLKLRRMKLQQAFREDLAASVLNTLASEIQLMNAKSSD